MMPNRKEEPAWRCDKGIPETGNDLLGGVGLPAAVIHEAALNHNLAWMQDFAAARGARLAPHGEITMAPALFRRQLEAGAWGITLATAVQCRAAFAHGVSRLLMANQLVGEANMAIVAELLEAGAEFYCVVDGAENVRQLGRYFAARGLRLPVLIELGVAGGLSGCRDHDEVMALGEQVDAEPSLVLSGLEGDEGVSHGRDPADDVYGYSWRLVEVAQALDHDGLFECRAPLITAAGTAWFDLSARVFREARLGGHFMPVLRPGAYVVHECAERQRREAASRHADAHHGLEPAFEVFAQIQSLPEPGVAIVALGARDIGGAPPPVMRRYREGGSPGRSLPVEGWEVVRLLEHHALVRLPEEEPGVRVGDVLAFGVSRPCLTFDKWRRVLLVDRRLEVIESLSTCF